MFRPLFPILLLIGQICAAPVLLPKGTLTVTIDDSPKTTIISAALPNEPAEPVILRIDWLNQTPAPTDFKQSVDPATGIIRSTHQLGGTHITRSILSSKDEDAIFIHFLADKPGDLSFRATLQPPGKGDPVIHDRRELIWIDSENRARKAMAWIIPFESDVEAEANKILLQGEGECLLILNFNNLKNPEKPVAETWKRLAATYDPGENPPDPSKIWQAILARAAAP